MDLDQRHLFNTGGSTSHSPGLVFRINPSKTMTDFARYTVDMWKRLALAGKPCAKTVGSLEIAWTPARLADLKRKAGYGMSWGVEAHLPSHGATRKRLPMLSERILGALYVPSDIQTNALMPAEAMAREAERRGAAFYGTVNVTGFDLANGRVRAVRAALGDIATELVAAAAGIWAPKLGAMAGTPIRLPTMQRLYAVTTPISELAGAAEEITPPLLRHQDKAVYSRQVGDCYGIGSYRREPLPLDAEAIRDYADAPIAPTDLPFTPRHFEKAMKAAGEILPCLKGAGLTRKINGLFSFTVDGFPVLGESPHTRGFRSAQAVWITQAAGVGKAVAEWIVNGEPTIDLRECDILRFHPHAYGRGYVRAPPRSTAKCMTSFIRANILQTPGICV